MVVAPPASLQEEEKGTWPGCPCPLSPCRAGGTAVAPRRVSACTKHQHQADVWAERKGA